jgi:ATP-dependent RNA helicase DOB1
MFNTITEEAIRSLPHIGDMDNNKLPETLTKIYTHIVGFEASYKLDEIPFRKAELDEDYNTLQKIGFVLELKLIVETNQNTVENIAYVAAMCREMMAMIEEDKIALSLDAIPSTLIAALLFTLARNFPDALEMLQKVDTRSMNMSQVQFVNSLRSLFKNQLDELFNFKQVKSYNTELSLEKYADQLMWDELTKGVQNIGQQLIGSGSDLIDHFLKVYELSYWDGDIYIGTYKIASFLKRIEKIFILHATINIPAPTNCNSADWRNAMINFSKRRAYVWQNHIDAISKYGVLNIGISSVITFPTGAGKSTLYELKVISVLLTRQKALILVPTHALESQVKHNMNSISVTLDANFSNIDGELTSLDETEKNDILVMTPERCLTLMGLNPSFIDNVGLVVFDEFHLISGNQEDKRAMESMLCVLELFTRIPKADYMFLSAMVNNGNEIASWVASATNHDCVYLNNKWKPTCQLQGCVCYKKSDELKLLKIIKNNQTKINKKLTLAAKYKNALLAAPYCLFSLNTEWDDYNKKFSHTLISDSNVLLGYSNGHITPNVNNVAINLALKFSSLNKKVIIFSLQPNFAYSTAKQLNNISHLKCFDYFFKLPKNKKILDQISVELGGGQYTLLNGCEAATVHTSDLLPEERYLSEKYFKDQKGVNMLVATATVAQGVNLPADVVIVAGTSRFNDDEKCQMPIEPQSIMNAIGRAGRAGYCSHGVSIIIPSEVVTVKTKDDKYESDAFPIIKNVFSKGDNCLTVVDPFESILKNDKIDDSQLSIRKSLEYRLSSSNTDAREKLSKSFVAYKSTLKYESKISFSKSVERFLSELPQYDSFGDELRLKEISVKTGYSFDDIVSLSENIDFSNTETYMDMTVLDIMHEVKKLFIKNSTLLDKFIPNKTIEFLCKWLGNNKENNLTKEIVENLFGIVEDYLKGATLYEIENKGLAKAKGNLINARKFVIKVIPNLSYMCGVIVMIINNALLSVGHEENEINEDLTTFASCVKEGVLSYRMLKYKHDHRLMRKACHNEYKG